MDYLLKLWDYQQADMAVDRYEREMKKSPNRQKLVKVREFLLQQQEAIKRIESDVESMGDKIESIRAEIVRLEEELKDLQETLADDEPESIEIVRKSLSYAQKLAGGITRCEQDLNKIRKDAEARDRQQHEVRVRAAKARGEFDTLKEVYDAEYKVEVVQLNKLRAIAVAASEGLPEALMEKYKQIKQHSVPPIAKLLDGNRCGGCNMNMPQAILRNVRTGEKSVECENCGRIVLVE